MEPVAIRNREYLRSRADVKRPRGGISPAAARVVKVEQTDVLFSMLGSQSRPGCIAVAKLHFYDLLQCSIERLRPSRNFSLAHTYVFVCMYMREESHPPWWFALRPNASLLFGRFRPRYVADQGIRDLFRVDRRRHCLLPFACANAKSQTRVWLIVKETG